MNNKPVITIIGGGFCGFSVLMNLTKLAKEELSINLIDKDNNFPLGLAYRTMNKKHVLNVPASKMSAIPEDPDNFINWIKSKPEYSDYVDDELPDLFMPRYIYGQYLSELFASLSGSIPSNINFRLIQDEATDINPLDKGAEVILKSGEKIFSDKIVIATGNFLPDNPKIKDDSIYKSEKYFRNPWQKESCENLKDNESVLIIGTGLTMVDNVISLKDNGFKGKIYTISTHGYFPLSHKKRKPYTDILNEIHPPYNLLDLYKIFRKHIKYVLSHGITGEAVVDAIRPKTQEIWLSLRLEDKIKFMSHVRHLWGVARHRLPKEIFRQMKSLISDGQIEIIAGRIREMREINNGVYILYKDRKSQKLTEMIVNRVINCTGPATDLYKMESALIHNLLDKGIITPDEMKLGVNALPDGTIIHNDNSVSSYLYTTGSLLKGILWESTAVPELRVQAKSLSEILLNKLYKQETLNSDINN